MAGRGLNRETIIATAMEIADEKGLGAVTLRGIAARLDAHVTSLYNHVPTKDAVTEAMVAELIREAKLPVGSFTWQEWVRQFGTALRALGRKHPGAFEAFHYSPAQGEQAAATFESAFVAFKADGFDAVSSYNAVKATTVAVLGLVLDDIARRRSPDKRTDLSVLASERYPTIHEIGRVTGKADAFPYLVESLIAGFAANRTQQKPPPRKRKR